MPTTWPGAGAKFIGAILLALAPPVAAPAALAAEATPATLSPEQIGARLAAGEYTSVMARIAEVAEEDDRKKLLTRGLLVAVCRGDVADVARWVAAGASLKAMDPKDPTTTAHAIAQAMGKPDVAAWIAKQPGAALSKLSPKDVADGAPLRAAAAAAIRVKFAATLAAIIGQKHDQLAGDADRSFDLAERAAHDRIWPALQRAAMDGDTDLATELYNALSPDYQEERFAESLAALESNVAGKKGRMVFLRLEYDSTAPGGHLALILGTTRRVFLATLPHAFTHGERLDYFGRVAGIYTYRSIAGASLAVPKLTTDTVFQ